MRTAVKAQTRCEQAAELCRIVPEPSQQTLLPTAWWQCSAAERRMLASGIPCCEVGQMHDNWSLSSR